MPLGLGGSGRRGLSGLRPERPQPLEASGGRRLRWGDGVRRGPRGARADRGGSAPRPVGPRAPGAGRRRDRERACITSRHEHGERRARIASEVRGEREAMGIWEMPVEQHDVGSHARRGRRHLTAGRCCRAKRVATMRAAGRGAAWGRGDSRSPLSEGGDCRSRFGWRSVALDALTPLFSCRFPAHGAPRRWASVEEGPGGKAVPQGPAGIRRAGKRSGPVHRLASGFDSSRHRRGPAGVKSRDVV